MREWHEQGLSIADVEIVIEANREEMLREISNAFAGYGSRGGPPSLVLRYRAHSGYRCETPFTLEHPGYASSATSPSTYSFQRRDSRGDVTLPPADGPVLAHFDGGTARFTLEAALRVCMSLVLPRVGGVFLHSSGVYFGSESVFFSGPSGAGKSTIAALLATNAAFQGPLGDDLNIARPSETVPRTWIAHTTPFAGELGVVPRGRARLDAIHFLRQAGRNRASRLDRSRALPRVLRNMLAYVSEREAADRALEVASRVVRDVPCYDLEFERDPGIAVEVLRELERSSDERRMLEA
jgi:hypothetical protein